MKKAILYIVICLVAQSAMAQSWEVGAMAGGSNYHGDLAYNIVPKETNVSGGAFFKYNFNEYWTVRPTLSYMKISGADSNFNEYRLRNLSFRNNIYEVSNVMEFNFQPFSNQAIHGRTTAYALLGLGLFLHKPEAKLNDEWVSLQPLRTENQKYKLMQISVPMGIGVKHAINPNFIVGFEAGWRKTFTDYLDDVSSTYADPTDGGATYRALVDRSYEVSETGQPLASQGDVRGDANLDDWFFQTAFSISYRFTPIKCPF
ncbi:DUF6089 family protein [Bacteroidia bacterium]|nr:DUF6089 family protein [Bacteroidia bacterium]MDB4173654.1 DUF6089 family protein [Bacteroidia bacterium]